jgi:hypothetical protein
MGEAGRRIAARWNVPPDLRLRLEVAVAVLHELGGMVELEAFEDYYCLRGYSCPLVAVVSPHRVPPHGVSKRSCPKALWRVRKVAVLLYRRMSMIMEKSYARMGLLNGLPATNRK